MPSAHPIAYGYGLIPCIPPTCPLITVVLCTEPHKPNLCGVTLKALLGLYQVAWRPHTLTQHPLALSFVPSHSPGPLFTGKPPCPIISFAYACNRPLWCIEPQIVSCHIKFHSPSLILMSTSQCHLLSIPLLSNVSHGLVPSYPVVHGVCDIIPSSIVSPHGATKGHAVYSVC